MKVFITETLIVNLDTEPWHCRRGNHAIGSARRNYKEGVLVAERDPREIHKPIIDADKYEFTFSPDPKWIRIIEFYCPSCGVLMDVDYLPPGHPVLHEIDFDIDAMKAQWTKRQELAEPTTGPEMAKLRGGHHGHNH